MSSIFERDGSTSPEQVEQDREHEVFEPFPNDKNGPAETNDNEEGAAAETNEEDEME